MFTKMTAKSKFLALSSKYGAIGQNTLYSFLVWRAYGLVTGQTSHAYAYTIHAASHVDDESRVVWFRYLIV